MTNAAAEAHSFLEAAKEVLGKQIGPSHQVEAAVKFLREHFPEVKNADIRARTALDNLFNFLWKHESEQTDVLQVPDEKNDTLQELSRLIINYIEASAVLMSKQAMLDSYKLRRVDKRAVAAFFLSRK
jgi:hypothetical protein